MSGLLKRLKNGNKKCEGNQPRWNCPACTYANDAKFPTCKICFTARLTVSAPPSAVGGGATIMVPPPAAPQMTTALLVQRWRSYGRHRREGNLVTFSQSRHHVLSNYAAHPPVELDVPPCCNPHDLASSGRPRRMSFSFGEMGVMACKAAMFRDYDAYDAILACADSGEAKRLGRAVRSFDQHAWDAHRCEIARGVCVAKLSWGAYRDALLGVAGDGRGDDGAEVVIAECTRGDRVWGTSLGEGDPDVRYPGRWMGENVLGWGLMEARKEALRGGQLKASQTRSSQLANQFVRMPSAPKMDDDVDASQQRMPSAPTLDDDDDASTSPVTMVPPPPAVSNNDTKLSPYSIGYLATQYSFGPKAFGPLANKKHASNGANVIPNDDLSGSVHDIVVSSVPAARYLKGQRGEKQVTEMLANIYRVGLFMHGPPTSSVNGTIIPAMRHIVSTLSKLDADDAKRVSIVQDLVDACQDCQQVQARVVLRTYSDMTCQERTLEEQLRYSLVRSKESALHALITKHHGSSCDSDHNTVGPERQRAHLWSGYASLIGDDFGLDGVDASRGDRFLGESLKVIRSAHSLGGGGGRFRVNIRASDDGPLKKSLLSELTAGLDVKEWLSGLISDINNQSADADRTIDRSCIFSWASNNTSGDLKHRIFYDEGRAVEYQDLDPKEPTDDQKYEPFFSPAVLVEVLVKVGLLQHKKC